MQLKLENITDINKGRQAIITAHGPSLNLHKDEIIKAHEAEKIIRLSVNNWWEYFTKPPEYWVISSTEFTIERLLPIINMHNITTFYSDDGDFTPKNFIETNVKADWLAYDQRHWQGKRCLEILKDIKEHFQENTNFNLLKYGNNKAMWQLPRNKGHFGHCITNTKCCDQNNPPRVTLQETLQNLTGCDQHYSTGDSVSIHAIAFAILMGCNPIYVSGLDLDYNKGYANEDKTDWKHKANSPNAFTPVRENFLNDLNVLNKSAELRGQEIINLNPDAWYDSFKLGEFKL
jgi:hypothetical protein